MSGALQQTSLFDFFPPQLERSSPHTAARGRKPTSSRPALAVVGSSVLNQRVAQYGRPMAAKKSSARKARESSVKREALRPPVSYSMVEDFVAPDTADGYCELSSDAYSNQPDRSLACHEQLDSDGELGCHYQPAFMYNKEQQSLLDENIDASDFFPNPNMTRAFEDEAAQAQLQLRYGSRLNFSLTPTVKDEAEPTSPEIPPGTATVAEVPFMDHTEPVRLAVSMYRSRGHCKEWVLLKVPPVARLGQRKLLRLCSSEPRNFFVYILEDGIPVTDLASSQLLLNKVEMGSNPSSRRLDLGRNVIPPKQLELSQCCTSAVVDAYPSAEIVLVCSNRKNKKVKYTLVVEDLTSRNLVTSWEFEIFHTKYESMNRATASRKFLCLATNSFAEYVCNADNSWCINEMKDEKFYDAVEDLSASRHDLQSYVIECCRSPVEAENVPVNPTPSHFADVPVNSMPLPEANVPVNPTPLHDDYSWHGDSALPFPEFFNDNSSLLPY